MADRPNHLYYGDNLDVLREHIAPESVDLIYLDPPFNSNRSYNVLFKSQAGKESGAQIEAFDDTWHWSQPTERAFDAIVGGEAPAKVAEAITAMRHLLGTNDVLAYLVMMTSRLVELRRVLKPTGSLYLHCDPTASHYLKVLLDAIFGVENYKGEVIWKRYGAHSNVAAAYGAVHDVLLFFSRDRTITFNKQYQPYEDEYVRQRFRFTDPDGRRWSEQNLANPADRPNLKYPFTASNGVTYTCPPNGWKFTRERMTALDQEQRLHYPQKVGGRLRLKNYLDEMPGVTLQDVWSDVSVIGGTSAERLGYPTQKPLALLERIISTSSNEGDVVLDPFCGCGTAVDAAQKLHRRWVGIDITYLAIDLIRKRLRHTYGDAIESTYEVRGIPADLEGARALFGENPFDFERWAVSLIDGQPNTKQVGDRGIDGVVRFHAEDGRIGRLLVSVKGGGQIGPAMVREIAGTVGTERAEMGVLILMDTPTRGMVSAAGASGSYVNGLTGQLYPAIQIVSVADLMAGKRVAMPTAILPYVQAKARPVEQPTLEV